MCRVQVVVWGVLVTGTAHCEGLVAYLDWMGTLGVQVFIGSSGWLCQLLTTIHMLLDNLGAVIEWHTLFL